MASFPPSLYIIQQFTALASTPNTPTVLGLHLFLASLRKRLSNPSASSAWHTAWTSTSAFFLISFSSFACLSLYASSVSPYRFLRLSWSSSSSTQMVLANERSE